MSMEAPAVKRPEKIWIQSSMELDTVFFDFAHYWSFYLWFLAFVLVLLALDLGVFHRTAHVVKPREAALWSIGWILLALAFCYLLYEYVLWKVGASAELQAIWGDPPTVARTFALEYLTGYVIEKALSVDNLFVFIVIFNYFAVPPLYQHRILFFGILGALVFRSLFIALGAILMSHHWVVMMFGVFLIYTGIKVCFSDDKKIEPERNPMIKLLRKLVPVTTDHEGQKFFVKRSGIWHATPIFVALVFVEVTDIVFAVDSVPAIYAITQEPFIVFTSNVFAILGLRSLYFLLAVVMGMFHLLKYGLGIVLAFVGLKMVWLNSLFGGKFPTGWSLGIISVVLTAAIVCSLLIPPASRHEEGQA